jgi:hypothetical protein
MKNATKVPSTVAYPMADHDFFPNLVNSHRQQVWIHENTVNSLVQRIMGQYLPWTIFDKDLSDQLMQAFPEFRKVFGPEANITLSVDMPKNSI